MQENRPTGYRNERRFKRIKGADHEDLIGEVPTHQDSTIRQPLLRRVMSQDVRPVVCTSCKRTIGLDEAIFVERENPRYAYCTRHGHGDSTLELWASAEAYTRWRHREG